MLQRETYPELGLTYGQLGIDDHTHVPPGIYLLIPFITWLWNNGILRGLSSTPARSQSPFALVQIVVVDVSLVFSYQLVTSQQKLHPLYTPCVICSDSLKFCIYYIVFKATKEAHYSFVNICVVWSVCTITSFLSFTISLLFQHRFVWEWAHSHWKKR